MSEVDNKKKQINDIVSVVKLSSLLFSGMAFFKFVQKHFNISFSNFNYSLTIQFVIVSVLILTLIYSIWAFSTTKKFNKKYIIRIQIIENYIFVLIFLCIILLTGAHRSDFKFLFLFIIITTAIQSGMNQGLIIAFTSSIIVLTIDLIYAQGLMENIYFEKDLILAAVFILTAWPLGFYVKTERNHIEKLQNLANEDGLTGVYNHRFFHEALREKLISYKKENRPISLIFIDIDHFKHYNDLYGHQKGDQVLKIIGSLLKEIIVENGIAARYGGEEFAIILPDTLEQDAIKIAENIRYRIQETYFEGEENQPKGKITASMGVSTFPDKAENEVELIKCADDALYRAKFFNKNRVETYHSILDELKKEIEHKDIDLVTSIKTLISVINAKDRYTYGHVERVVFYSRLLAEKLGLSEEDKKKLVYGAYMHDIGKINIGEEVLNKKMPLNNEEWEVLKQHPANGVEIINPVKSLSYIAPLILHHHERYDGKGYPDNLKGENIPYLARILTVVDSFDAMTSNRPYSKIKSHSEAIEELKKCRGSQFDPDIADAFIEVIEENKDNITY
ncbi:diguanylate cyclase (GGDEF) domain-containing protein [Clostridium pasteurianum DSM 525 = ATCC 6013]|uniref:Diguanylate cyclase (GGDEF) domain-containing protein n=1 Tax=Clostridium pasteurianum DSM 525 = ATCC 6013 TaxID=1262449 RepID=A0A0H3J5Z1_CLOPA|nr:diguanylate cyclase [Clostridium pasteurianum]AJA48874.1 diguanylate cyclase (GGDEF) domain-containing protein [Clostridium pasteurianum DSM 525 = ATCC 6013]AJA52862.1 diguanylate cyclase (GGDEF) domain-containing protein [Clostridium pasteurianum DSM 525 = ATCC 6013]AOZ76085.1 diguanylate cyclase [Clostridium pasteurianum DSM 525 = ATCC 6013]AOZ79881.1 diguanylate cyclase [Clostridium pasteurianum]ELP60170.1 two-component response regulator [Clostridium pasteurianum DSM 525 = ATCC 6013]